MPSRYGGLGPSRVRTRVPSTHRLRFLSCAITTFFPVYKQSPLWRCLVASSSFFLHAAMNLRVPSVTVSSHTSASNAVAFRTPTMPDARVSLCTQSVHSFSFPTRLLRTAPSRFPKTTRFVRQPLTAHSNTLTPGYIKGVVVSPHCNMSPSRGWWGT